MFNLQFKNVLLVILLCSKMIIFAQTTGPSQPEVHSFQAASITNMVETSTGEFQYSITLFTIGGYPVTVNYSSQVGINDEASMVGLGFNLNCGAITRQVRGIFDDSRGDTITKLVYMKPNKTTGIDLGISLELVGIDKKKAKKLGQQRGWNISSSAGLFYNNYNGWGIENRVGTGFHGNTGGLSGNAGIGINANSQHGTSINPYCGVSYSYFDDVSKSVKLHKTDSKKYKINELKIKPSAGSGGGYDFNSVSYSPKIEFPFTTLSLDFSLKAGFAGALFEVGQDIRGYQTVQKLETNVLQNRAYGFLYADDGKNNPFAMMDFARDEDGVMTVDKPNLAFAYATPDVYSVAGHGVGGTFEIKRNNVFVGFDPRSSTNSTNAGVEAEVAFGTGAHAGGQLKYGYTLNTTEKWNTKSNGLLGILDFNDVTVGGNTAVAEKTYFKNPDDVMFNENPFYSLSGDNPITPQLSFENIFGGSTMSGSIGMRPHPKQVTRANFVNNQRDNRLDVIYYLTAAEAASFGLQKKISIYKINEFSPDSLSDIERTAGFRKNDHFSEITCLKPDGARYVFNLPAYNISKRDVSYSINESDIDISKHETDSNKTPDLANFTKHTGGKDDFISITETPAYAHSFLLGAVLSANYVDVGDDGPTINDIGDYVKFNYAKLPYEYYWRSNNNVNVAMADQGNLADKNDGKAFYTEGYKEVWYIHDIQTKTEIARFFYSDRLDAYDLKDTAHKLKKLDSILIFSRPELLNTNPVPYRRVYFGYDSNNTSLCKGINGNPNLAKLTLHSIYFKNGTSNKGKYSAYTFEYGTKNPDFDALAVDRWGSYKPNTNAAIGLDSLDNKAFPFAIQDSVIAAQNAEAWLLHKINLPSGGEITIDYEAHDYAYVQNKKAMYMTPVIGITNFNPSIVPTDLAAIRTGNVLYDDYSIYNYLIFKLKNPIPGSMNPGDANLTVRQDYLTDPNDTEYGNIMNDGSNHNHANLYGKFRVTIKPDLGFYKEDIPTFLAPKSCGAIKLKDSTNYEYGYIELEAASIGIGQHNDNANQISKTAWQFVKHTYAQILFGMDADPALDSEEKLDAIVNMLLAPVSIIKTILQTGPNLLLKGKNVANTADLAASYIRLYVPDGIKFGGNGARVKNVHIFDKWHDMAGSPASSTSYSIHYDYRKLQNNKLISAGVASYETESGGEENSWKQPIFFVDNNFLMPDDNNFMMTPYGESLFPSARIVYSEVRTTKDPVTDTLTQAGTGYTINKYYTNYDFPCKVDQTRIQLVRNAKASFKLLKNISNDYMVSTQGYLVITNNMHGKQYAEETFGDKGNLISAKYYLYKETANNELDNRVRSIDTSGHIQSNQLLGVETQLYGDARRFHTESYSGSVHGNLDIQPMAIVPIAAPSIWPDFAFEKKTFSSFTLTKFIRQQGILDRIIVVDKGATISTKNELWDAKTGAVLLTSTINEFEDPVYNFTYPAHWAYMGMGMASDNISATSVTNNTINSLSNINSVLTTDFKNKLIRGDVIAINSNNKFIDKYVVSETNPLELIKVYLSTPKQLSNPQKWTAKIILSGKKNLATTSIGSFTSLINPVTNTFSTNIPNSAPTGISNVPNLAITNTLINPKVVIKNPSNNPIIATANPYNNTNPTIATTLITPKVVIKNPFNNHNVTIASTSNISGPPTVNPFDIPTTINKENMTWEEISNKTIRIINAMAVEYANKALERCACLVPKWWSGDVAPGSVLCVGGPGLLSSGVLKILAPWQPEASYKYVQNRVQTEGNPITRKNGFLSSFTPFWTTNTWKKNATAPWQFTERLSIINSRLKPVESVNPLHIFSSVQHSNFEGMVNATTANARHHETLSENFEDMPSFCDTSHYTIIDTTLLLDNLVAHTGYYSMKTGESVHRKTFVFDDDIAQGESNDSNYVSTNLEPKLTLMPNKKYILSAWVKERNATNTTLDYDIANIEVFFEGTAPTICKPSGHIIDGWQRIVQEFDTPSAYMDFSLNFSANTNFDDIRIFPADANMKSYVYSYKDYSLMAILDENNFATFYEYNQEKQLKTVKKETAFGVVTIQEVNFGSYKK